MVVYPVERKSCSFFRQGAIINNEPGETDHSGYNRNNREPEGKAFFSTMGRGWFWKFFKKGGMGIKRHGGIEET